LEEKNKTPHIFTGSGNATFLFVCTLIHAPDMLQISGIKLIHHVMY